MRRERIVACARVGDGASVLFEDWLGPGCVSELRIGAGSTVGLAGGYVVAAVDTRHQLT